MAGSTYSTNLKLELMTTGENSGTWGDVTNTNLGTALEQAVVGYGNPDYVSDANLTISITNTNAAQPARALVLNVTSTFGSLTATRELVVPTIQKQYIVQNNTSGGQSITVKTSAGTGITVPNGRKAHLYVDGTNVIQMFDFVDINGGAIDGTTVGASSASTGAFTTLNASGATTLDGNVTLGNASGDTVTVTGTIASNLLFTDNTYDIGASGATRPRNLYLAGAATIGGNLSVGGTLTLTGGVNLNGNVTVGDSAADTLTINSTVTSNLIFTDNTYDIGASGATRPRNLFLAGNATVGGAQTLTGALTVDSTTDSSSTTTGSIQTDGGLGVAKALYVGTTANIAGAVTLSGGTANGVLYLNGSKSATSGTALVFDGTNLGVGGAPSPAPACTNIELPYGATLSARSNTVAPQFAMMSNAVGDWFAATYKVDGYATQYTQQGFDGTHKLYTAPSGTAGSAISFTAVLTVAADGKVTSTAVNTDNNLTLNSTAAAYSTKLTLQAAGGGSSVINATGASADALILQLTGTQRAALYSGGLTVNDSLIVGTTTQLGGRFSLASSENKNQPATLVIMGTSTLGANDFQLITARNSVGDTYPHYSISVVEQGIAYRTLMLQPNGGAVAVAGAPSRSFFNLQQPADGNGITISHASRSNYWQWYLSGVNNENYAFTQNNGTSTANSYIMGRDTHEWFTGGTSRASINSAGNFGINTTNPPELLSVVTSTNYAAAFNTFITAASSTRISIGSLGTSGGGTGGSSAIGNETNHGATAQSSMTFFTHDGTSLVERARFNPTGAFVFNGGTTTADGIGITFPATQVASSNANTLDDYEQGTWTPAVRGSNTAGTYTTTAVSGTYTKIGNMVVACGRIEGFSAASGGVGYAQITGLPFQNANSATCAVRYDYMTVNASTIDVHLEFISSSGQTTLNFRENYNNSSGLDTPISSITTSTAFIIFTMTYITND